jgi:hypothetical protein
MTAAPVDKTVILIDGKSASLSDLKPGQPLVLAFTGGNLRRIVVQPEAAEGVGPWDLPTEPRARLPAHPGKDALRRAAEIAKGKAGVSRGVDLRNVLLATEVKQRI